MHRARLVRAIAVGVSSALGTLGAGAQGGSVQLAVGSHPQPPDVELDSGAAWSGKWKRPSTCATVRTSSDITAGAIYLDATMALQSDSALTSQADLIASDVATELRKQLGGSDAETPNVGDKIKWNSIPAELILVARPDGSMTWRGTSLSGDAAAVGLLATAMDSVRRHGSGLLIWPEGYAADSLVVRLSLLPKSFPDDVPAAPTTVNRVRFSVFTMPYPPESPALPKGELHIKYPTINERLQISGYILAQFVVDTGGRADLSTFRAMWPSDQPQRAVALDRYYDEFVQAMRESIASATFTPARVGSCPVRQTVKWPMKFVSRGANHGTPP